MSLKLDKHSGMVLDKLEALKKKVAKEMQVKEDANFINKYRCHFDVTQPSNLIGGTLKQHQLEALEWMINLSAQESNGILADDMGLGKTIQAIAFMAYLREENGIRGKHLVVCPKSVSNNWIRQINKWFPSANVVLLMCTQQEREECLRKVIKPRKFDIVVTTYEGVKKCFNSLSRINWEMLVVDQAHKIKNFQGQNFAALYHLNATFKLLMTGTPLSNNLQELWCLLYFIMPEIFNDRELFNEIEEVVNNFQGTEEEQLHFKMKVAKYFHGIINPYFKRRAKKDLELGLPAKIQKTLYVPLSKMQLQMYRNFLRFRSVYGEDGPQDGHYMNARKICLHPYLFPAIYPSDADSDDEDFCDHWIENSGKLKVLDKLLKKMFKEGHKVLLFSQFTMLLDILEDYCNYRGIKYCRLDGTTSLEDREEYMNDFNNTDKYQLFLLSTRAGGLGVNLIGADRVIIYDIDWNPQNDVQAMDRAYRIGQTKPVHVYKLIAEHTIQERISQFQKYKLIWDELVIQKGGFMSKKQRNDPFQNYSMQNLINLGKGDIFKLQIDQTEKSIQEIEKIGELKNKKMEEEIRQKLKKNIDNQKLTIFDSDSDDDTVPQTQEEMLFIRRRNYQNEKREYMKFTRNCVLPPFKFYLQGQKIRQYLFEIHMEEKRQDRSDALIKKLEQKLEQAKKEGKFDNWEEEQFQNFVDAHQLFLKDDYQQIAAFIKTKTEDEVREYSQYFFLKAPNSDRFSDQLTKIKLGQTLVKINLKQQVIAEMDLKEKSTNDEVQSQNEKEELYKPSTSVIRKTKQQLLKEITMKNTSVATLEKMNKKQQQKLYLEQKKKILLEEKQKREEEKKKEREEIQKKKEQRIKERIARNEEKQKRAEAWKQMLKLREENKEKREKEKIEKKQKRERQAEERKQKKQRELEEKKKRREEEELRRKIRKEEESKKEIAKKESQRALSVGRKSERSSTNTEIHNTNPEKKEKRQSEVIVIDQ